jgi:uncharacterized protein YjbI with pentapeptide repeats
MPSVIQNERFSGDESLKRCFQDTIFVDCQFEDYVLEGAQLTSAVFVSCLFRRVDFYWASMYQSRFIKCDLEEVDFRGASMLETVFALSRLVRCNFAHDNLGADTDLSSVTFHLSEQIDCDYTPFKKA